MDILPKEITICSDTKIEMASFSYYDGIDYAKKNSLKQCTTIKDVYSFDYFIVCCGDVMVRVKSEDFPNLARRII